MQLEILQTGEPVLRQKARELSVDEIYKPAIQQLIKSMIETMHNAPGVGLAAPQVGQSLQLIVIEDKAEYMQAYSQKEIAERERFPIPLHIVINPKLTIEEEKISEFHEGCLSIAGFVGITPRVHAVKVECLNEKAEPVTINARGWYARILQHEIDHLNGVLCIDRMKIQTLCTIENFQKYHLKK